jgi:hypothetical protein
MHVFDQGLIKVQFRRLAITWVSAEAQAMKIEGAFRRTVGFEMGADYCLQVCAFSREKTGWSK